jgi:deoxyribonuclease-4
MRKFGVHTSIAGGLCKGLEKARELGCTTLQIFSHNPRGWSLKQRQSAESASFRELKEAYGISPVFIHTSYLINLATRDRLLRSKSLEMIAFELDLADAIGAEFVILHPGSASDEDPAAARDRIISCLRQLSHNGGWKSRLLLENTTGRRGDAASRIPEIAEVLAGVGPQVVSGLCIDTCHAFAAGYDIRTQEGLTFMCSEIRRHCGKGKIKLLHLNDSKGDAGSGVDRHEHLGRGRIGLSGLQNIISHPDFSDIPVILETPKKSENDDPMNLNILRALLA